jgi:hypothetical protein
MYPFRIESSPARKRRCGGPSHRCTLDRAQVRGIRFDTSSSSEWCVLDGRFLSASSLINSFVRKAPSIRALAQYLLGTLLCVHGCMCACACTSKRTRGLVLVHSGTPHARMPTRPHVHKHTHNGHRTNICQTPWPAFRCARACAVS